MATIVSWEVVGKSARVCRDGKPDLILSIGDCFKFDYEIVKRSGDDICVVNQFTYMKSDSGPIGFTYLPWRVKENRWGSEQWTLQGNARHLICMPCGIGHRGHVINWDTFQIVDGVDHIDFKNYIEKIKQNTNV
jgi:hypothetical protein